MTSREYGIYETDCLIGKQRKACLLLVDPRDYPSLSGSYGLIGDGPVATVRVTSPREGDIRPDDPTSSPSNLLSMVLDYGGPNGPNGVCRTGPQSMLDKALREVPGFELAAGDREYLGRYLLTKKS